MKYNSLASVIERAYDLTYETLPTILLDYIDSFESVAEIPKKILALGKLANYHGSSWRREDLLERLDDINQLINRSKATNSNVIQLEAAGDLETAEEELLPTGNRNVNTTDHDTHMNSNMSENNQTIGIQVNEDISYSYDDEIHGQNEVIGEDVDQDHVEITGNNVNYLDDDDEVEHQPRTPKNERASPEGFLQGEAELFPFNHPFASQLQPQQLRLINSPTAIFDAEVKRRELEYKKTRDQHERQLQKQIDRIKLQNIEKKRL